MKNSYIIKNSTIIEKSVNLILKKEYKLEYVDTKVE